MLHLQYYQKWKHMILKCEWKVNLFCDNHATITCWLKKRTINSRFWSTHFFENIIFRWHTFGKFYIANFNYLVEDLIRWKRGFKRFLIDQYAGDTGNKNIAGKYQNNSCISGIHLILDGPVYIGWYIYNFLVHITYVLFTCM